MLCLTKKTEYALIALAHLAGNGQRCASAREIAAANDLPAALLMNLLKSLQAHGLLRSTRGAKGGYQLSDEVRRFSLAELISVVECQGHQGAAECGCREKFDEVALRYAHLPGPIQALQLQLDRFLKEVHLADVVMPGRRIEVPVETLTFGRDRSLQHAHSAE